MSKWQDLLDGLPGLSDDERARAEAELILLEYMSPEDRMLLFRGDAIQASRRIKALLAYRGSRYSPCTVICLNEYGSIQYLSHLL